MNKHIDSRKLKRMRNALGDPCRLRIVEAIKEKNDWMVCMELIEIFNLA